MQTNHLTNRTRITDIYFAEIRKTENLTKEREKELFSRVKSGDKTAETEIFESMARLGVAMAKTFTSDPELLPDLIQEANMGILRAISGFNPEEGCRFASYARWWMKLLICGALGDRDAVHQKRDALTNKVNRIRRDFYQEYGRDPQEWEVMDILEEQGVMVKDPTAIQQICMVSIEMENDEGDVDESREFSGRTCQDNGFEEEVERESVEWEVRKRMARLTDREKTMVMMKFGLGGYPEMDYDTIAKRMTEETGKEMGPERARQIVTGALKRMR